MCHIRIQLHQQNGPNLVLNKALVWNPKQRRCLHATIPIKGGLGADLKMPPPPPTSPQTWIMSGGILIPALFQSKLKHQACHHRIRGTYLLAVQNFVLLDKEGTLLASKRRGLCLNYHRVIYLENMTKTDSQMTPKDVENCKKLRLREPTYIDLGGSIQEDPRTPYNPSGSYRRSRLYSLIVKPKGGKRGPADSDISYTNIETTPTAFLCNENKPIGDLGEL
ncbi:hypothetical protein C8J56DRAFT_896526 [Mycena floridula]|nr:hypothetical protein C8J56DRAFT_896526 [Mycena floridula]